MKKYPTFRERSEIPEVSTEISLQPWRAYGVDGCILFSDILTPLPGMGVEFDIEEKAGPKLKPMRTLESLQGMYVNSDWTKATPFVKQTLGDLRKTVRTSTYRGCTLRFVGSPPPHRRESDNGRSRRAASSGPACGPLHLPPA